MAVTFHELIPVTLSNRKRLKVFLPTLFLKEGFALADLNIVFCSDEYLLIINNNHLQHDYYTDIITFDLSDTDTSPIIGELYISVDRVRDNAILMKTTVIKELHRVIFHGALHLCGFRDKSKKEIITMRSKEEEYLDLYTGIK